MATGLPDKLRKNRKKAIKYLVQGRALATQLQNLLDKPLENHGSVLAEELAEKILRSFTDPLSVLSSCEAGDQLCQIQGTTHVGFTCSGDLTSEDSGESRKNPAPAFKGRASYKRKKATESWMIVSLTMEDGYAWRKYGQKEILNAKHPRCYFRCTHKYDKGCLASKQVQRTEGDYTMYQTTYYGHHTCRDALKAPRNILDSDRVETYLLSFNSSDSQIPNDQAHPSCLPLPSIKEQHKEEVQSELSNSMSSLDSSWWPDLIAFESSKPVIMLSPKMESDHEDVVSGVYLGASTSSHGLDMEDLMRPVDFDNDFHFEENVFLLGS